MVLRRLVLLCLVAPLHTPVFSRFDGGGEAPWCPPPSRLILLYSTKRFDNVVEGMVIRGLELWCPLLPS